MKTIKAFIIFCLGIVTTVCAQAGGREMILQRKISIELIDLTYQEALNKISTEVGIEFVYVTNILPDDERVTKTYQNLSISDLLTDLFAGKAISFHEKNSKIILTKSKQKDTTRSRIERREQGVQDKITITGTVTNEKAEPLPGVTILVKGTATGTATDHLGNFKLEVDNNDVVLIFSFLGYVTEELTPGNQTVINLQMTPDLLSLTEVIVVGYGAQKKSDIIGSVSSIDGEDINLKSVSNFDAGLQGMAAGVSVLSQSGKPGAPSTIKIRGANSIQSSTDPLWVIDGMPVYSSPTGLGSSNQNPMSLINPNDIESIQVLKDAAATSIYGSRGSNGVIIVTTKTGKAGKSFTNINLTTGISEPSRTPEQVGYTNTEEWFSVMDEAFQNSLGRDFQMIDFYSKNPDAFDVIDRDVISVLEIDTDWYNEVFRTGTFQDFNVSSSRGFDKGSFYLSANYRSDKGVLKHNQLDRITFRSNLAYEPIENLTANARLSFAYTDNERRDDDLTTIIKYALPWMPVMNPNAPGEYFNSHSNANLVAKNDPANTLNNVKQYRALGNLSLEYKFPTIKGLSLRGEMSTDIIQSNIVIWRGKAINLNGAKQPSAFGSEEAVTFTSINYNIYPTFTRDFGRSNITLMMGAEAQRTSQYQRRMSGEGLTGRYQEIGNPKTLLSSEGRLNNERYLLGFFGRANYNLDNRYLLGVSARRDGSSAFSPKYRWGTFVAFSAGWVMSEEEFFRSLTENVYIKLRASFGETGNQGVPNNLQAINFYEQAIYGSRQLASNGTVPANLPVEDLTWETTESFDLGLDFGFLEDRINGTFGYYHRFIDGMLLQQQLPSSVGVSPLKVEEFRFLSWTDGSQVNRIWSNIGNMENSGLEFELYTVNVSKNNFRWTSGFNISLNRNEIQSLSPRLDASGSGLTTDYTISRKGDSRNVWYLADYAGVDPENGVPYIYAVDNELFLKTGETVRLKNSAGQDSVLWATVTNIADNKFIQKNKASDPTYYGGFTNKVQWNGFDLTVSLSYSGGNYILDYDRQIAVYPNATRMLLKDVVNNAWRESGDQAKYPKLVRDGVMVIDGKPVRGFNDEDVYHNRELYRADFVRLRTVELGYSLKSQTLQRLKLAGCRVYLSGNNLWTHTNYPGFDPEGTLDASGAHILKWNTPIPQLRSFIVGLDVKI